ncbi:MAG: ACP phosphodiesterase [Burkholderiales bacterium]|jgi:acyl carrier protein phosphodiesterase|nr:ACP phosphodiesterase [Burkholderiales bacterium]
MNWLAHVVLAPPGPHGWTGAVLGDFVKGAPDAHGWPAPVIDAIRQHRAIDTFTDAHPEVRAARARFGPGARRWSGVLLDLWFDHCLARDWARWQPAAVPLPQFTAQVNAALADTALPDLPERFVRMRPHLIRDDWMAAAATPDGLRVAVERMAGRLADPRGLRAAYAQAQTLAAVLDVHFAQFWPALSAQAPHLGRCGP